MPAIIELFVEEGNAREIEVSRSDYGKFEGSSYE